MRDADREALTTGRQAGARYGLAMPRQVPMGLIGSQVGQRAGASLEFKDHREYQPGDDPRRIDWAAYARTDRPHVKLYHEEVNPHLDLIIDGSASMALPGSRKQEATLALAAAFAAAAENSGAVHTAWLAREGCHRIANDTADPGVWEGIALDDDRPLGESIARMPPDLRPRSIRILISDLLYLGDPLEALQPLARGAAVVAVVQLLAEADADPPQRGNIRLADSETGELQDVFIEAGAQRRYREALARHQENWHRAATQTGAVMTTLVAEPLLRDWDLRPLVEREILQPS